MNMPPPIAQANIGMADTMILMVLALVVFGPRRLPQIGKQIGKLMYEFRKASNDFKWQMEEELRTAEEADRRKRLDLEAQASAAAPLAATETPADAASEPRILPPSTGEPVATERPGSEAAAPEPEPALAEEPQARQEPAADQSATDQAATDQAGTVTEQAAHHG